MTEFNYEKLLETAFEKMPKKTKSKERFELPTLISFIQGKQTIIKNLTEAANKINRDPKHILKYIAKDLGTTGTVDGQRGVLTGNFKQQLISSRFDNYIKEYLICKECGKPDTELIKFEGIEYKRCEVCGARAPVKHI